MIKFILSTSKDYTANPFEKDFITNSNSKALTKKQQKICWMASILLSLFTFGVYPILVKIRKHYSKYNKFKAVIVNNRTQEVRPTKTWKSFPTSGKIPDFSYTKPKVDFSSIQDVPDKFKSKVESRCLEKMKEAMKVLDPSIVDATTETLLNPKNPEFLNIVNTFSTRILDIYKAYVEIQIDQHQLNLPMHVNILKAAGFTHKELLDLREPCQWYQDLIQNFRIDCLREGLKENEIKFLLEYISSNQYKWDKFELSSENKNLDTTLSNLYQVLNNSKNSKEKINRLCDNFVKKIGENETFFIKIKEIDLRLDFIHTISQGDKEAYKESLAKAEPFQENDQQLRLLHEIQSRFELREFETGAVGSPLRLLNILEGKHDKNQADQNYRTKLFFCYGSKGMLNEICQDPKMVKLINDKLREKNKGWQIDENLACYLSASEKQPVYKLGIYANENNVGFKTRHYLSPQEAKNRKKNDPNLTYAEAERIAKKENVTKEELNQRFRFQLSESEEISLFGTMRSMEERELQRKSVTYLEYLSEKSIDNDSYTKKNFQTVEPKYIKNTDTHLLESSLNYQKKSEEIRWQPGKHFFQLHTKAICKSAYLDAVDELGLPQYSGISGSTDQTFTMAGLVGIQSKEELMNLRFIYLPWMAGYEDHSVNEIMTATKTFNLEYHPSADYYKQILPSKKEFIASLRKAQQDRGYEMPDYYLSKEYAEIVYQEEMQKQLFVENEKNQEVMRLMLHHQLLMQTPSIYKKDYSISDLFGDNRWRKNIQPLKQSSINKKNRQRIAKRNRQTSKTLELLKNLFKFNKEKYIKYALSSQTGIYEFYKQLNIPYSKGTNKTSVSLIPSTGKILPYIDEKFHHLNRVGLLFDGNECEFKSDKFVFRKSANPLDQKKWRRFYSKKDTESSNFSITLNMDSEEMVRSLKEAGKVSMEELVNQLERNKGTFAPYNEILASVKGKSVKGIFVFSKGLPQNHKGKVPFISTKEKVNCLPLHAELKTKFQANEDYDRYMLLLGIGKQIATREEIGIDVPLYEINENLNKGLSLVSIEKQINLIREILNDDQKLDGITRIIFYQGEFRVGHSQIKNRLKEQLKEYLRKI